MTDAFTTMDQRLSVCRFLHGDRLAASDFWLFPTLLCLDGFYSELFGLGFQLGGFEKLGPSMRDLWSLKAFYASRDLERIEAHDYRSLLHGPKSPSCTGFCE